MAAPMIAEDRSLMVLRIGVADKEVDMASRPCGLSDIRFTKHQNHPKGGRHADIPVYTTFRRQNHGCLKRFRPARVARIAARHCFRAGYEATALAEARVVEGFRQMGATDDRATQGSLLPAGPGT